MNPDVYDCDRHGISLQVIDPDALNCVQTLQKAGYVAYVVGGGVRDLLLGQRPKDYDISTSAKPEEIKRLFRSHCILIGKRFRLAHIRYGKKVMEVSTFRSGSNESDQLIVRDNEWGTPEQDALRRDFTINGLFYDPSNQTIIDYVNGYIDIQNRYLRTIGHPFLRFKQDPVRMIRLIKFQARFGFEIDTNVKIALVECRPEIIKSSQARILEELLRMLESGAGERFIHLMNEHGFLEHLLPSLTTILSHCEGAVIYSFLREVDVHLQWDRAVLLCCLVFPFLLHHLQMHFTNRHKKLHLGEIYQEVQSAISAVFHPFFLLPRRLRAKMSSILMGQFRMTPLDRKPVRTIRIPRDPDFPLALEFFALRARVDGALLSLCRKWQEVYAAKRPHHSSTQQRL